MSEVVEALERILPKGGVLTGDDVSARSAGWGRPDSCTARAIVRPRTTDQVCEVLALCHRSDQPIVPMGGLTGLVQGGIAQTSEVALSLELMTNIELIDEVNRIAIVEAGVPVQTIQEAVEDKGLFLPLDLGSRGTATVGGVISTNAGGNRVIRFGMTRDMVLGLEAVLADGTVLTSLNRVLKNNAGYDLKHLFIGSEGTLGIVTRAVMRLREKPPTISTALCATESLGQVRALLKRLDSRLSGTLSAFEVMWNNFYRLVTTPPASSSPILGQSYPYYLIIESMSGDASVEQGRFETALTDCLEEGLLSDAVIAKSEAERAQIWAMRDDVGQTLHFGIPIAFDVSMPISEIESYVDDIRAKLDKALPAYQHVIFGHLGDGNIHVVMGVGDAYTEEVRHKAEEILYTSLKGRWGSVSAEHGIGLEKKAYLGLSRTPSEINVMRSLKTALDPKGILNPGKIFDV